jgi:hypothetical protein
MDASLERICSPERCESLIAATDALIAAQYTRENAIRRRTYVFEFGSPFENYGFALHHPGAPETDDLPGFRLHEIPGPLAEITRTVCARMRFGSGRVFFNVSRYPAVSAPVPAHYDGELFDFTVTPGEGMGVRRGIRPSEVALLTLRTRSAASGPVLLTESGEASRFTADAGDLLHFDNLRYRHSVPDLDRPAPEPRQRWARYVIGWRPYEDGCYLWSSDAPLEPLSVAEAAELHREFLARDWPKQVQADLARASF